jgi:hypothetical protein
MLLHIFVVGRVEIRKMIEVYSQDRRMRSINWEKQLTWLRRQAFLRKPRHIGAL